ncbi:MAG: ABC transporter permease [Rhodospirillales bacterium]|nr:ABC transporter permease [Rhodospirillales bacterium]
MNAASLAIASIRSRPLHAALCTAAVAAGIALLCAVFLFSQTVSSGFARNAAGIDMIVGTKGSPLQLVLSSVYHADIPAGNIDAHDFEELQRMPQVRQAIPLALGDSYKGFRMVGTSPDYLKLYNAEFADGKTFAAPFETVAGANTGLKVGDKFAVSHGFSANSDDVHDAYLYTVIGVLKPTGTVLDKLLTTPVESVQQLHAAGHDHHEGDRHGHDEAEEEHEEHAAHHHEDEEMDEDQGHEEDHHAGEHEGHDHEGEADLAHQITSVILKVRSPVDLMNLPRKINESSDLMAAVPSYEMARFTKSLGIGRQLVVVLGAGFVILSALMLWATLSSGLALRRYDLAVLRVLGATPRRLSATVIAEALLISGAGALAGVILGHGIAYTAVLSIESLRGLVLPEVLLMPQAMDAGFIALGLIAGVFAAFVPSLTAARTDIAGLLARGRA